jgi:hypothetical protein
MKVNFGLLQVNQLPWSGGMKGSDNGKGLGYSKANISNIDQILRSSFCAMR